MNVKNFFSTTNPLKQVFSTAFYIIPLAVVIGLTVAAFLYLLDIVTNLRQQYQWLIFFLPLAGIIIYWLYKQWGKDSSKGNNLIIDEIHQPGGGISFRMAPLVLVTTLLTHLFGGSAGREGTAVQMGGSTAFLFSKWLKLNNSNRRTLLLCGMSAGFGAVFGTPVTGAIFALEVIAIGRIKYDALLPCLLASVIADITCSLTGIHHTSYHINFSGAHFDILLLFKAALAGIIFGLTAWLFANTTHFIKQKSQQLIPTPWLIPAVGGVIVIGACYLLGTFDYIGIGVTGKGINIVNAFKVGGATNFSWIWKLLLTAITLGMGFKGGEVTPLFFIGATLGNTIAMVTHSPVGLFAGLGFIAVFAGATNTPLACTIMGVELFGGEYILYYAVACFAAYYCSGHTGIYSSQKVEVRKWQFLKSFK